MTRLTSAQEYGVYLGRLQQNVERFFQQISEGFKLGYNPPKAKTAENLERARVRRYKLRIERERELGRLYVERQAEKLRSELGLADIP